LVFFFENYSYNTVYWPPSYYYVIEGGYGSKRKISLLNKVKEFFLYWSGPRTPLGRELKDIKELKESDKNGDVDINQTNKEK
jgi:hypothetical protein